MAVDGNIQVWLETDHKRGSLVTPYVQSAEPRTLQYRVRATKEGSAGRSELTQSGRVKIESAQPVALGKFSMSVGSADKCRIELSLLEDGALLATYILPCPR